MRNIILAILTLLPSAAGAQFNTDRLVMVGRSALYYEDYVLSIQYFNQAINSKPFLYEPWFYRGVAKFYLDDFTGAESDCFKAIELNPFVPDVFELRGLCRIRLKDFKAAIADYDETIKYNPDNKNLWYNRVLCRIEEKDYDGAHADLDKMIARWHSYSKAYSLKAEVCMQQKDTLEGVKFLDKSLEKDPYDADAWAVRAMISLSRSQWKDADMQLGKAIHLKPHTAGNYVNRALARYNINNLRGALADYDKAIEIEPENFLAHYNRGQLRVQVGDDNRAIEDFDFVVKMEPDNVLAIYNRGLLRERTGDIRGAISDYSTVIKQFPNFWVGLNRRAHCYRLLGMTGKAEMDEFRIFKAQNDKHYGVQPRWSRKKRLSVRKKSDIDMDKYNQLVVADDNVVDHEYASDYRGRVQNRKTDTGFLPMYRLSFTQYTNGIKSYQVFDNEIEAFNRELRPRHAVHINCNSKPLDATETAACFALIDTLSAEIDRSGSTKASRGLLLQRAVAHIVTQNFDAAVNDLTTYAQIDSTASFAYWQRGVCQTMMNEFNASQGMETGLKAMRALADFDKALALSPSNAYIYYNRANLHAMRKDYAAAVAGYTRAIELDPRLAEAYYNRGLARIYLNQKAEGIQDLSKAGELGIYGAYSVIKKYR